jgi:AcrR family transcriptional regulator
MQPRARILAAARHVFAQHASATLAEVAQRAGVSRATVHRHFGSREQLLRALNVEAEPGARERALNAAIDLLARDGLAHLSMDEVAAAAEVSRANLYRLFPGKAALFVELMRVYSPLGPIGATVSALNDQAPCVVMPEVARAIARHLEGRAGLARSLLFEATAPAQDANAAREFALQSALVPLTGYLQAQMEAGRLRRMHPLLAMQSFAGPIVFHLVLRPFAQDLLGFSTPAETALVELAEVWLRAMEVQ